MSHFTQRFRQVVSRLRGLPAVEDGTTILTYRELDQRASLLARRLRATGVGRETVVALALPKSADYLVGMLAVWYAGGAFLPLDPALPPERRAFMVRDGDVRLLLTSEGVACPLGRLGVPQVLVGSAADPEDDGSTPALASPAAEDLAYIIYTSGSTGTPKGVMVPHRGIVNLLDGQIPAFGLRPGARALWLLSPSFDASVSDIGTALLSGATLCIEPGPPAEIAADLIRILGRRRITHLDLPPSLLPLLDPDVAPACLETLVIGGEPCPPEVVRRWAQRCRVVNVYGPTEATVCASLCLCDADRWHRPLLGEPLPNVTFQVLDEALQPVPPGVAGELFIGGIGLARGYVNRPELTASRFLTVEGERLYRTGDRVVRHPDGDLEYLGRTDRQVKVRGQLVAPEEVEACLLKHPDVRQAAVLKRPIGADREGLVAFVVPTAAVPSERDLRAHLQALLPPWMVPQLFRFLDRLPVTRTGKTDLEALSHLDLAAVAAISLRTTVTTPRQQQLAEIWREVLERPVIGIDDDFFDLGGDSLAVLRIAALAEARGLPLSPAQVIRDRTIAAITGTTEETTPETWGGMTAARLREEVEEYLRKLELTATVGWGEVSEQFLTAGHDPVSSPRSASLAGVTAPGTRGSGCRPPSGKQHLPSYLHPPISRSGLPVRLLTGATGFLGSRLLYELLHRTDAQVRCLVRAEEEGAGLARIREAVERHGVHLPPAAWARVAPLCGDLTQPYLGLPPAAWESLCAEVDTVHHCGAWVNMVHSYEQLRPVNLGGTGEILRLMAAGRPKHLHYASTLSVFVSTDRNTGRMEEGDDLSETGWVYGGYGQSKWAAEHLVRLARPALRSVTVYRLGLITGDTRTGYAPERDQLGLFLRGLARLGCVPEAVRSDLRVDITPVDYAAAAMAHLSLGADPRPGLTTFHIAHPTGATAEDLICAARDSGVPLERVGEAEWRARVARHGSTAGAEAISTAFLSLCRSAEGDAAFQRQRTLDLFQSTGAEFAVDNTQAALAGSGIRCPPVTPELLQLYARQSLKHRTTR